jgi:hypothetical protein
VLAEQHDEWTEMRRYIGLDILAKSRLTTITNKNLIDEEVTITAIPRIKSDQDHAETGLNTTPADVTIRGDAAHRAPAEVGANRNSTTSPSAIT